MRGARWVGSWEGGRRRELADGSSVWVIERAVGPHRRTVTLDVHTPPGPDGRTPKDVLAELALFERDPLAYKTRRQQARETPKTGGVFLDEDTLREFFKDQDKRVEKGDLTKQYVDQILAPYLGAWAKALRGRDLRGVSLLELQKLLSKWDTAEHKRVIVLKAFTAWLRERGRLVRSEDPTLDLKTPPIIPAKNSKPKGYPIPFVESVYRHVTSQAARDVLVLRAKVGLHDTEIARIAQGSAALRRIDDPSGIAGTITFYHLKKDAQHVVSVDAQVLAAAERLQARKRSLLRMEMKRIVDDACRAAGLKWKDGDPSPLQPGSLRHSFATWAKRQGRKVKPANQEGVSYEEIAEHLGHTQSKTTKAFYVGDHVPNMIAVPVRLEHPEDPVPFAKKDRVAG